MGSVFNTATASEDTTDDQPGLTPELWLDVNAMVRRLGTKHDVAALGRG